MSSPSRDANLSKYRIQHSSIIYYGFPLFMNIKLKKIFSARFDCCGNFTLNAEKKHIDVNS
jgi:hypothetical protein